MDLPWSIAFLMAWLKRALEGGGRMTRVLKNVADLGEAFRSDAKAEGMKVVVGGWECLGGRNPKEARWYAVEMTRENAPWAFAKGEPFRVVAALELFGTLLSIMAFGDSWPRNSMGTSRITGTTDNGGNPHVLSRLMTSKFPLVVILAELAEQLRQRDLSMSLDWVPRDQNEEADDLTNLEFGRFRSDLRLELDLKDLKWKVLPELMELAQELYQQIKIQKEQKKDSKTVPVAKARPGQRLRDREPWG